MSSAVILSFIIAGAILVSATMSAANSAMIFLPPSDSDEFEHVKKGSSFEKIINNPSSFVVSLRFWRVWFETLAAAATTVLIDTYMDSMWKTLLLSSVVVGIVSFVIVSISPGKVGLKYVVPIVKYLSPFIYFFRLVLGPIPRWLSRLGEKFFPGGSSSTSIYDDIQLSDLAEHAEESDAIEDDDVELIHSVAGFSDTLVREVMVPRMDMITIEEGSTLSQAMRLCLRSGFSRIPVIGEDIDDVTGIIYLKDINARIHLRKDNPDETLVESIARQVRFVPEFKEIDDLLKEMQKKSTHVAIVVDEYGGTAGLVTLEDILEELVGEIVDEYDNESSDIEEISEYEYRVASRLSLQDLSELLDRKIEDEDVETVGGLLTKELGEIPILGSTVTIDGITLIADQLEGRRNRLSHVIVIKKDDEDTEREND
ncbi:MAG: hemolysin family protein [Micrococcaceae bacterium]